MYCNSFNFISSFIPILMALFTCSGIALCNEFVKNFSFGLNNKLEIWRSHTPCACSSLAMLASNRLPCIGRRGFILQNLDSPEKGQGFSAP